MSDTVWAGWALHAALPGSRSNFFDPFLETQLDPGDQIGLYKKYTALSSVGCSYCSTLKEKKKSFTRRWPLTFVWPVTISFLTLLAGTKHILTSVWSSQSGKTKAVSGTIITCKDVITLHVANREIEGSTKLTYSEPWQLHSWAAQINLAAQTQCVFYGAVKTLHIFIMF